MPKVPGFAAMSPLEFRRVLERLGYVTITGGKGSHEKMVAPDRPPVLFSFNHSKRQLAPIEVRNYLVRSVGLTLDEAREAVK